MDRATITAGDVFGYGDGLVSEFGSPPYAALIPTEGSAQAATAGAVVNGAPRRDFWRSSDFGLILFGLALLYFDLRIVNR